MALFWRSKILVMEIESTYGVSADPDGADAVLAKDVTLSPMEGNDLDRELEQPFFGSTGSIPTELHVKLSFKVELAPSGTAGTAPAWGKLLRICGVAETIIAATSVAYNPITDDPEAGTIQFFIGGTRHVMLGARGTASFEMTANQIPYINFELWGLFSLPTEEIRPTPNLSAWKRPQEVGDTYTTLTLDGEAGLIMRKFMMSMNNQVEPRFLVGSEEILITDRTEQIECTIEATDLATYNPYSAAFNQSEIAMTLAHGTGAGRIATFGFTKAQMQRPQGLETPQNITEWPLRLVPIPTAGSDQWTLTLT
mgnify:CR=1 FL=1|tara:strand:- start:1731 stop:2660 length:930 start_codon:yes stop_codon:yes gene_type:complete